MSKDKKAHQTIFRTVKNADNPFVMIDRRPIENSELSWGAKGVFTYILSRPDNWEVRIGDLVNHSPEGVNKIRGYIRELINAGHAKRIPQRDPLTHQFVRFVLEVYELPFTRTEPLTDFREVATHFTESHFTESHLVGSHLVENRHLNNTDINDTELINGAKAPKSPEISNLPIEWQIGAGVQQVTIPDPTPAQRMDVSNLIATGLGTRAMEGYALAMAFQDARDITFTQADVKGQRKAVKYLLEKGVKPEHVTQAVKTLMEINYTCADLYSITSVAVDLANKPEPKIEYTRLL